MLGSAGHRAHVWKGLAVAAVMASAMATVGACKPRATGFQVEISADPNIRREIQMVRVRVYAPPTDLAPIEERDLVLGPNQPFPATFNVVSSTPETVVRIDVDGFRTRTNNTGDGFVRARAITNFVAGQTLFLPLRFYDACVDRVAACNGEFFSDRCNAAGACEIADIDTSRLARIDPEGNIEDSGVAPTDAGFADTGMLDAGTPDTGTPDAGFADTGALDAGTPDTGTPDAGTADTGRADAGFADTGALDAGRADAGRADVGGGG